MLPECKSRLLENKWRNCRWNRLYIAEHILKSFQLMQVLQSGQYHIGRGQSSQWNPKLNWTCINILAWLIDCASRKFETFVNLNNVQNFIKIIRNDNLYKLRYEFHKFFELEMNANFNDELIKVARLYFFISFIMF